MGNGIDASSGHASVGGIGEGGKGWKEGGMISFARAWFSIIGGLLLAVARAGVADDAALNALFTKVRPSLVVITTQRGGAATGFITAMDGKQYLVTNEHVVRGGYPFNAKFLNGRGLSYEIMEFADDRDLVRLAVSDAAASPIAMSAAEVSIGEAIAVFGNSEGGGVATSLGGKVLGVGPDRLEVDAAFIGGNSGSPVVDMQGRVLGIASYITRAADPNDWVKKNTRFANPRRFALCLNDVKWITMANEEYFARANTLADMETYCVDVYDLLYTDKYAINKIDFRYDAAQNKGKYRLHVGLCKILSDVADLYSGFAWERAKSRYLDDQLVKAHSMQEHKEMQTQNFMTESAARARRDKFKKAYDQIYAQPSKAFGAIDWKTTNFKHEATFWLTVLNYMTHEDTK